MNYRVFHYDSLILILLCWLTFSMTQLTTTSQPWGPWILAWTMDVFGIVADMCIITDDLAEVESVGPDVNESVEGDEYEEDDEDGHDDLGMVDNNGHCTTRAVSVT